MIRYLVGAAAIAALLATPAYAQEQKPFAILKICKVAGSGVPVGTPFNFTTNPGGTVTVAAGSGPGGNCWIAGGFAVGSTVVVTEVTGLDVVTNITLAGGGTLTASPPNPTATVSNLGAGMNVVTYTNERKKIGYLEICKYSQTPGNFTFNLNPGGTSVTVPAMGCSPPIQAPAGPVTITETAPGFVWTNCYTWQAGVQVPCGVAGNTATVTVVPGGVQGESLVFVINTRRGETGAATRSDDSAVQRLLKSPHTAPSQ